MIWIFLLGNTIEDLERVIAFGAFNSNERDMWNIYKNKMEVSGASGGAIAALYLATHKGQFKNFILSD